MDIISFQNKKPLHRHVVCLNLTIAPFLAIQEIILKVAGEGRSGTACYMVIESQQNPLIAEAVNSADWVVADGVLLIWALKGLYSLQQERVAGMNMMPALLSRAVEERLPVFFYGSTPDVLAKCVAVCEARFPRLHIAGTLSHFSFYYYHEYCCSYRSFWV